MEELDRRGLTLYDPEAEKRPLWPAEYCSPDARTGWKFVRILRTWNEAEQETQPFPDRAYLRRLVREWCRCQRTGRALIVEKSRRLVTSWLFRALELWLMGRRRADGVIVHRTHPDAAEHVWRIWHLYEDLRKRFPEWGLAPARSYGSLEAKQLDSVVLPNGSQVEGHYEKAEGLQGSGFAFVTMEELSLYRHPGSLAAQAKFVTQASAKATNGLRVTITNASPSAEWDEVKHKARPRELLAALRRCCLRLKGIAAANLPGGARYVALHYSADPEKDAAWAEVERQDTPERDWLRQMEMHDDVYDGLAVFADYRDNVHRASGLVVVLGASHVGGWDCGASLVPAFVDLQLAPIEIDGATEYQVQAIAELVSEGNESMEDFAPRVNDLLSLLLPGCYRDVDHWADATVKQRSGTRRETAQEVAREHGFELHRSSNNWPSRHSAVTWLLKGKLSDGRPLFQIDASACPVLHQGFQGAYKLEESPRGDSTGPGVILGMPLKNGFSHVHDALQYAAMRVRRLLTDIGVKAHATSSTAGPAPKPTASAPHGYDQAGRMIPPRATPRRR